VKVREILPPPNPKDREHGPIRDRHSTHCFELSSLHHQYHIAGEHFEVGYIGSRVMAQIDALSSSISNCVGVRAHPGRRG
jgi:hypothetical protein